MLIDFTVENYRSIKDPVTLSAIAVKRGGRKSSGKRRPWVIPDHEIAQPYVVEGRGLELLPVLGIFGANASGKTNVLRALNDTLSLMANGVQWVAGRGGFIQFALDEKTSVSRCAVEIRFAVDGSIYTYRIKVKRYQLMEEEFSYIPAYPTRKTSRLVFRRTRPDEQSQFLWKNGPDLSSSISVLQRSVSPDEAFIHFLIRRLSIPPFNKLGEWLSERWPQYDVHSESLDNERALQIIVNDRPDLVGRVARLVKNFDTGIEDVDVRAKTRDVDNNGISVGFIMPGESQYIILTAHKSDRGKTWGQFTQESAGTQRLFTMGIKLLAAIDDGALFVVDELDASLHPNITQEIVRLFQDPETNPKRAQLIFTSHDNTLLDDNLLRRDQVWFTEKRQDGSTALFSLSDFRVRNDLALDKAYLDGRLGAVPFLPSHEFILSDLEEAA